MWFPTFLKFLLLRSFTGFEHSHGIRFSQPLLGTFSDLQRRYVVDVQTMCSVAWDDDSDPVISPEEERERQRMNESCSEHTSDDPLDICYISNDIHTSPGKYVSCFTGDFYPYRLWASFYAKYSSAHYCIAIVKHCVILLPHSY